MPGLYGFLRSGFKESKLSDLSGIMQGAYHHLIKDSDFNSEFLSASRVHLGKIGMKQTPFAKSHIKIWIEGEFYNSKEMSALFSFGLTLHEGLCDAYLDGQLDNYLNKVDGYFAGVLYDEKTQKLLLFSDRYGTRLLYFYMHNKRFAWSSEPKLFFGLNKIDKSVNKNSVACFFSLGYLVGENTFFEHIKLLKPATILEYDILSHQFSERYYWKWSEIKPQNLSFDAAVDLLGKVFIDAVKRRYSPKEKIGIALSGGLDSRAIFAAINKLYPDSKGYSFTFGKEGSLDDRIAKSVSKISQWSHHSYILSPSNWFEPRLKKIWDTDGMLDMLDMHGCEFLEDYTAHFDINMSGYAGDAVCGGSLLGYVEMDRRIDLSTIKKIYKAYHNVSNWKSDFYDIAHGEPVVYMYRVRRSTNMGIVNTLNHIENRLPFFDNKVIELIFSIPDAYRLNNRLYSAMLLKFFPDFFSSIPWKSTGLVVGKKMSILRRIIRRIESEAIGLGLIEDKNDFTNYPEWIRAQKNYTRIKEILTRSPSYLKEYLNIDAHEEYLQPHLKEKQDFSRQILRAVTIEVYFSKVFTTNV